MGGSVLEVFSNSRQNWYKGVVGHVNPNDTLTVRYEIENGDVPQKDMARNDESLRAQGSAGSLTTITAKATRINCLLRMTNCCATAASSCASGRKLRRQGLMTTSA